MRPRELIHNVRDFERFLTRRGFTRREARVIISEGWRTLENQEQAKQTLTGGSLTAIPDGRPEKHGEGPP